MQYWRFVLSRCSFFFPVVVGCAILIAESALGFPEASEIGLKIRKAVCLPGNFEVGLDGSVYRPVGIGKVLSQVLKSLEPRAGPSKGSSEAQEVV